MFLTGYIARATAGRMAIELGVVKTGLQAKVAQVNKIIADCQALG